MATEPTLTLEQLQQFFEERPALKANPIGVEAGLGVGYLGKVLKGEKPFTPHIAHSVYPIIYKYGYGRKDTDKDKNIVL